jgi:hypothetical protein
MDCSGSEAHAELPQNEAGPLLRPLRDQGEDRPQPQEPQRRGQSHSQRMKTRIIFHAFLTVRPLDPGSGIRFFPLFWIPDQGEDRPQPLEPQRRGQYRKSELVAAFYKFVVGAHFHKCCYGIYQWFCCHVVVVVCSFFHKCYFCNLYAIVVVAHSQRNENERNAVLRIWDTGSHAFFTPGSGIRNKFFSRFRFFDPGSPDPCLIDPWILDPE